MAVNGPEVRKSTSEQTQESSQRGATTQQTTPAASDGDIRTLTLRVTGSSGERFGANYGDLGSSRSVDGVVPMDYEVEVHTDPLAEDYVYATVWKTAGDSSELKVQIIDNGRVVKEGSTTKDYGAASVRWNPNEQQPGTTTPSAQ